MQGALVILAIAALVSTAPLQDQEDAEAQKAHRRGERRGSWGWRGQGEGKEEELEGEGREAVAMQGALVILAIVTLVSTAPLQDQEDAEAHMPHRRGERRGSWGREGERCDIGGGMEGGGGGRGCGRKVAMQGVLVILAIAALVSTAPLQEQEAEAHKPHRRGERRGSWREGKGSRRKEFKELKELKKWFSLYETDKQKLAEVHKQHKSLIGDC